MKQPASTLTALTLLLASLPLPATSAAQTDQSSPPNNNSVYAELAKSPKKAAARRNPLADDPEAVAAGSKLFAQHCAECHGEAADGKKGPSLRAPEVQDATPGALFWLLTNGVVRKGMPVWSKLPDAQRWQLVTYIKSLGGTAKQSGSAASPQ